MNIQEILEAVESMSLLQVKELVDAMKEKFGVTGAIAVAGGPAAGGAAAAAEEEKTEFDVVLKDAGSEIRSQDHQGSCLQGRSREDRRAVQGCWRHRRNQVISNGIHSGGCSEHPPVFSLSGDQDMV